MARPEIRNTPRDGPTRDQEHPTRWPDQKSGTPHEMARSEIRNTPTSPHAPQHPLLPWSAHTLRTAHVQSHLHGILGNALLRTAPGRFRFGLFAQFFRVIPRHTPRNSPTRCFIVRTTLTQTCQSSRPGATCVQRLDDSQGLQFTLVIALCCVLHRCTNQEIRRW